MVKELKEETIPENAREWKVSTQINTGISSYSFIGLPELKEVIKAARDMNDKTPVMPIEPWVLRFAFEKADEMIKRIKDKNIKLISVKLEPRGNKTLGA